VIKPRRFMHVFSSQAMSCVRIGSVAATCTNTTPNEYLPSQLSFRSVTGQDNNAMASSQLQERVVARIS
jgi:hypothetical protein